MGAPLLFTCIATFRRASFPAATLGSMLANGATASNWWRSAGHDGPLDARLPSIVDRRGPVNFAVDADFHKPVTHVSGTYCWLRGV